MSWTDIFPVLDDAMLEAYRAGVSEEERKQFEEWFGVDRVVGGYASRVSRLTGFQPVFLELAAAETATDHDTRDAYPPFHAAAETATGLDTRDAYLPVGSGRR